MKPTPEVLKAIETAIQILNRTGFWFDIYHCCGTGRSLIWRQRCRTSWQLVLQEFDLEAGRIA